MLVRLSYRIVTGVTVAPPRSRMRLLTSLEFVTVPAYFAPKGVIMAKSMKRETIKLVSTGSTGYYYTTTKKKGTEKLLLKKYDPRLRKHIDFKEGKIK